jgi:hypothetical protein
MLPCSPAFSRANDLDLNFLFCYYSINLLNNGIYLTQDKITLNITFAGKRQHKEHLYRLFAQITSAMANPHRLELLDLLAQAPRTVEELAQEAHMSLAKMRP